MNEDLLREIPLFSSFSKTDLHSLAELLEERTLNQGSYLFREGAVDHCLYILLDGEVEVVKAQGSTGERVLAKRGPGSIFGEMSMFTSLGEHTASVRARSQLRLLKIRRREFVALLKRYPALTFELVRLLYRRLEESENLTIQELLGKHRQLSEAYEELKAAQLQIIEKEKLEHEMSLARRLQRDILPRSLPDLPGLEFSALMVPARAVAVIYDVALLDGDRIGSSSGMYRTKVCRLRYTCRYIQPDQGRIQVIPVLKQLYRRSTAFDRDGYFRHVRQRAIRHLPSKAGIQLSRAAPTSNTLAARRKSLGLHRSFGSGAGSPGRPYPGPEPDSSFKRIRPACL
jgi:CRP-like cAMP-binding protein